MDAFTMEETRSGGRYTRTALFPRPSCEQPEITKNSTSLPGILAGVAWALAAESGQGSGKIDGRQSSGATQAGHPFGGVDFMHKVA